MNTTKKFPDVLKLRNSAEFQIVYKKGARKESRSFVVFLLANGLDRSRLGLTTPRKVGIAVERNRIRRRIREIFRLSGQTIPRGFDIVVNPRRSAYGRDFGELRTELLVLLGAAE